MLWWSSHFQCPVADKDDRDSPDESLSAVCEANFDMLIATSTLEDPVLFDHISVLVIRNG